MIDSPDAAVPRQSFPLTHITLTSIVIPKLPRGARSAQIAKIWEKEKVTEKWNNTSFAKRIAANHKRWELNDFDRFKVMVLKKQRRYEVRKAVAKARKAAA